MMRLRPLDLCSQFKLGPEKAIFHNIEINNKRPPPPKWIDSHVIKKSVPHTHNQDSK